MNTQSRLAGLPLRAKLAVGMIFCALILVALTLFAIQNYNETLPPVSGVLLRELSDERLNELSATIYEYELLANQIAIDPLNQPNFSALNASSAEGMDSIDTEARRALQILFRQVLNVEPTIRQIRFVSVQGQTLISLPSEPADTNETDEEYFNFFKGKLPTRAGSDIYISTLKTTPSPILDFVAVPVDANQAAGFVVVSVDVTGSADTNINSIYRALRPVESEAGTVAFYLLDNRPQLLEPSGKPVNLVTNTVANMRAVLDALPNTVGEDFGYTSPLTGTLARGVVARIPNTGLYLVTEIGQGQFIEGTEGLRFAFILFGAMALGTVLIGLVGFTLDSALIRPTEQLLDAVQNANAESAVINVIEGKNEISRLQSVLNSLKTQAQQNVQTLDAQITQRTRRLEAAQEIGRNMATARTTEQLLEQATKNLSDYFADIKVAQIYLVDEKNASAVLRSSSFKEGGVATSRYLPLTDANFIGHTYLSAQPQIARSVPGNAYNALVQGMRSELALPLIIDGRVIGLLDLQSDQSTAFSEADIRLFTYMAEQLTATLRNLQFVDELEGRLRESEMLTRQLMGESWRSYTDTGANKADASEWTDLQRRAAETGQLMEDITDETVTFAIPVTLRGEVIGAVEWDVPRTTYNENTRLLARELAARLAISADNARLFEQTQRIAQRERLVNNIASKLIQQTDVTEILKVAVREVGQALRVPQTAIRLATTSDSEQV